MTATCRRTILLDPDVAEAFDQDAEGLSALVNSVLREELERRRRADALVGLVASMDAACGPPDEADVRGWAGALRPAAAPAGKRPAAAPAAKTPAAAPARQAPRPPSR